MKTLSTLGTVFMQGVKNLVVKKHNLPITKIVDELMEVNEHLIDCHKHATFDSFDTMEPKNSEREFITFCENA